MKIQIAIDGPSAVGKSSVAKKLAERFNLVYVNTGLLFRSFAYFCQQKYRTFANVMMHLEQIAAELKKTNPMSYSSNAIHFNGNDITNSLRVSAITDLTSQLSQKQIVRDFILD